MCIYTCKSDYSKIILCIHRLDSQHTVWHNVSGNHFSTLYSDMHMQYHLQALTLVLCIGFTFDLTHRTCMVSNYHTSYVGSIERGIARLETKLVTISGPYTIPQVQTQLQCNIVYITQWTMYYIAVFVHVITCVHNTLAINRRTAKHPQSHAPCSYLCFS